MLCVFAATVFWFFNALNKSYTANITFPLSFDFSQEGYMAVRPLPDAVKINVTGIGWNLFRRSVGVKVPPLVIPLERPSEVRKIVGSTLPALFANQLEGFQINFVLTDTLYLNIEPRTSRWVTLKLDSPSIHFRTGYGLADKVQIVPDSIFINGPLGLINNLSEPHYLRLDQRNIDARFKEDVDVKFLNEELIRRDPPTVTVSFEVDPMVMITDSIDLRVIHVPDGVRTQLIPKFVVCSFALPRRVATHYVQDSVHAVIDLKGFKKGEFTVLPQLTGLPHYSNVLKNDSVRVKL